MADRFPAQRFRPRYSRDATSGSSSTLRQCSRAAAWKRSEVLRHGGEGKMWESMSEVIGEMCVAVPSGERTFELERGFDGDRYPRDQWKDARCRSGFGEEGNG